MKRPDCITTDTATTKVKACEGPLPPGTKGYEFTTEVLPDVGHVPNRVDSPDCSVI